jgi:hypothetical protein
MMNLINRAASCLALALALTASAGCGNLALVGRPALELGQDEFVAEVERLDTSSREIHLRPNNSRTRVVGYSADARAVYRGREYPAARLERGDIVVMQLRLDSRGNSYTDLIRVQESNRDWDRAGTNGSGSGIQTVDGRVEQVDLQRSSFEIRGQSRDRIFVSLPNNARRSDVDRFRALRVGDHVRVEGRFLDRERFELENFLRENPF